MKKISYLILENLSYVPLLFSLLRSNFKLKRQYTVEEIQYGEDPKQKTIIVLPKNGVTKKHIITFIHGGAWRRGSASIFRFVGGFFAKFGYATIIVGYRLVPKVHYPIQVNDSIVSINAGMNYLETKGFKSKQLILVGQSAGGHLATLITFKKLLKDYVVSGVVSVSGPIHFATCQGRISKKFIQDFVQTKSNYQDADPYQYLSSDYPILCLHGKHDPIIEIENSIYFIDEVKNSKSELIIIKKGLHANLVKLFWFKMKEYQQLFDWMNQFENERGCRLIK